MTKNNAAVSRAKSEPTADLSREGVAEISKELRHLLADVFALYVKTKNFHWHMSGVHFRDYHLLLDEHAEQIFAMADDVAQRAPKIAGRIIRLLDIIQAHKRLAGTDRESLGPQEMLPYLLRENREATP